jgi:hypothetical protein
MTRTFLHPIVLLLAVSSVIFAQQPPADPQNAPPSNPGWRPATDSAAQDRPAPPVQQDPASAPRDAYGQAQQPSQPSATRPPAAQPPRPAYGIPAEITIKPGTTFSMRINQKLNDTKNSVGDTFTGTLMQPIVVNGILVAQRGQMVYGRVAEAQKVKKSGVHRLGIEVTGITLADGSQAAVHTLLMSRQAPPMPYWHKEEGAITTAAADGSTPAAGAAIGVLATKGHDSVIYPETLLTFRTENAVTIDTKNSAGAFRYVSPDDYNGPMRTQVAARPTYAYGPGYPYYPYPYYGWGYPYPYWGPVVGFGFGFGGNRGGWRGGFRR